MATKIRVEMNRSGIADLLKSEEVQQDLQSRATAIANAAGDGFEARVTIGATRARAVVITATEEARKAEGTDRKLTRAVDAGR